MFDVAEQADNHDAAECKEEGVAERGVRDH